MSVLVFFIFFFSVQRFVLSPLNAWICAAPLVAAIYFLIKRRRGLAVTWLSLALLCSVDLGGDVYAETPMFLRYAIYLSMLAVLAMGSIAAVRKQTVLLVLIYFLMVLVGTSSALFREVVPYNFGALRRDFVVCLMLALVLFATRPKESVDLRLIAVAGLGFLIGELTNILFFFSYEADYLSYSSLKVFVFFPAIYTLTTADGRKWAPLLFGGALVVAVFYASRMILLSFLVLSFLAAFARLTRDLSGRRLLNWAIVVTCIIAAWLFGAFQDEVILRYRVTALISEVAKLVSTDDFVGVLEALDRVRFGEHVMFFDRPSIEVLFGSGLGSGLYDAKGVLSFLPIDAQQAFTAEEISSGRFFNLHDFWVDFGLRFGVVAVAYVVFIFIIRQMRCGFLWTGMWFGLLIFNATFSTAGLLLITVLYLYWPEMYRAPPKFLNATRATGA
jgi:hypothetical protein